MHCILTFLTILEKFVLSICHSRQQYLKMLLLLYTLTGVRRVRHIMRRGLKLPPDAQFTNALYTNSKLRRLQLQMYDAICTESFSLVVDDCSYSARVLTRLYAGRVGRTGRSHGRSM